MFLDDINFKQPKYMIPLIIYVPVLFTAYFVLDMFKTELAEKPTELETTEYLNTNLPVAKIKNDGIGNRYDNMLKSFGRIQDFSAVENIERGNGEEEKEEFSSKYTDEDLARLDEDAARKVEEMEKLREMQEKIRSGAEKGKGMTGSETGYPLTEEERLAHSRRREEEAMAELNKALAEARLKGQKGLAPVGTDTVENDMHEPALKGKVEMKATVADDGAVRSLEEDSRSNDAVKLVTERSDYFNTIAENESEPHLIKAIIDENIKAVDGSRVRLRLLDDIRVNDIVLQKGAYVYAVMSGFGSQRVKGNVQSILVDDELVKVNLSLYDTDGLEGLYVPSSKFRETAKNVASGAVGGTMSMNGNSGGDMFRQWGMQALNNAYQKTSNAISSAVKQNRARLKYGTYVYLVNGREKRDK